MSMFLSGAGSALIGLVFWAFASHLAPPAAIGRASATISAMFLLAGLAQLSFGSTFERFIPVAGNRTRSFVVRAYRLCVAVAFILAIAYVSSGFTHRFLPSSFGWRALFVTSVVLWTIFALQDSVLIGLRVTHWVPVENIVYSLVKLALLPVFIMVSTSHGVFLAWMTPVVFVIIVVNWYIFKRFIPEHEALNLSSESLPTAREFINMIGAQYATLIVSVLSSSITTLIVIARLGAVASAHYYLPGQIASGAPLVVASIFRSFLVEASAEPEALRRHARVALRASLAALIPIVVIGEIVAPEILRIFGATYAAHGTTLLRLLLLCVPGAMIMAFYSALAWLDRRLWQMTVREAVSALVFFCLLFSLIGHFGILAVGIASLIQSVLEGALFLPALIRRYHKIFE